jgi:hypothetical protein
MPLEKGLITERLVRRAVLSGLGAASLVFTTLTLLNSDSRADVMAGTDLGPKYLLNNSSISVEAAQTYCEPDSGRVPTIRELIQFFGGNTNAEVSPLAPRYWIHALNEIPFLFEAEIVKDKKIMLDLNWYLSSSQAGVDELGMPTYYVFVAMDGFITLSHYVNPDAGAVRCVMDSR